MVKAVLAVLASGVILAPAAAADGVPDPGTGDASCLGLGSAFYGTFAPQQRAFVAQFVIDSASATGMTAGEVYVVFAQEKEGGDIPAPCGTRLE